MSRSGRDESRRATVICASPARDGPRSVELASIDANGPVITAELVGAQPALRPDATISAEAVMSADRRRQISVMALRGSCSACRPPWPGSAVCGGGAYTVGLNWFAPPGSRRGAFSVGETGAGGDVVVVVVVCRRGFGGLLFTGATCGDHSHRDESAQSGNCRETTRQTTLCPHCLSYLCTCTGKRQDLPAMVPYIANSCQPLSKI